MKQFHNLSRQKQEKVFQQVCDATIDGMLAGIISFMDDDPMQSILDKAIEIKETHGEFYAEQWLENNPYFCKQLREFVICELHQMRVDYL